MANIPISQLSALTASTSTTLLPVVEGGETYKIERDQFIPRSYGNYISTQDQTISGSVENIVVIDQTNGEVGMALNTNQIEFAVAGVYSITASYQFTQAAGSADVAFYFKKDGNVIPDSATHQTLTSNSKATSMVTIVENFNEGEKLELAIYSTSNNTKIDNIAGSGPIPDAPGLILTINQLY